MDLAEICPEIVPKFPRNLEAVRIAVRLELDRRAVIDFVGRLAGEDRLTLQLEIRRVHPHLIIFARSIGV